MVAGNSVQIIDMTQTLRSIPSIEVLDCVGSGIHAINRYRKLHPEIIFSDVALYGMSGFETARFIKEQNPRVKVIMCSQKFEREFLLAVLSLKLNGYLPGYGNRKVLEETLHSVIFNNTYSHFGFGSIELAQLLIYQYQNLTNSREYAG